MILASVLPSIAGFVATLIGAALLLWAIAVVLMANARLRPPRMTDGKALFVLGRISPADLSLPYETDVFEVAEVVDAPGRGKLLLHAWWIPHPLARGRCVILLHGYADARPGALAWLPMLHDLQINVLMLDQRAHGQSTGVHCTAGYFERQDLSQVIDQLRKERPSDAQHIAILGISMGGVTAIAVGAMRDDLAGIIADSPFGDYTAAGMLHADLFGFPGWFVQRPAAWLAQRLTGARFAQVSPLRLVPQLRVPLLLIQPSQDRVISAQDAAQLRQQLTDNPLVGHRSRAVIIPGAAHVLGLGVSPEFYETQVSNFLRQILP